MRGLDVYVVDVPGDGIGTVPSVEIAPSIALAPGLLLGGSAVVALIMNRRAAAPEKVGPSCGLR